MPEQPNNHAGSGLTRNYQRRPEVEAEISLLPDVHTPQFYAALEQVQYLETLVQAIRQLQRTGHTVQADDLANRLLERAFPRLLRIATVQFPSSRADQDDAAQSAALQLYKEVLDASPEQEFWEVFFDRMLYRAISDAADKIRKQREHEQQFDRGVRDDGESWSEEDHLPDPQPLDFNAHIALAELLAPLDGDIRRAMFLHAKGYKAKSNNPNEPTISSLLGITDRTVRTYLRKGEEIIRERFAGADQHTGEERSL